MTKVVIFQLTTCPVQQMANLYFIKSEETAAWLAQFATGDQQTATELLLSMKLVPHDQFIAGLRELVLYHEQSGNGPVGLYAEREVLKRHGIPHRLFKQPNTKHKRAYGNGPDPVKPKKGYNPEVGSEGIVAHFITELCKEFPDKFQNHPGPARIRDHKVRRFFLITDYIGSGKRAKTYIQAAWRVRSVRSWRSSKADKGMRFEVIAYSGTTHGIRNVEEHPSRPSVHIATSCPTIDSQKRYDPIALKNLCRQYDPVKNDFEESLGYLGTGALIAFAHGVPNNAPRLLYAKGKGKKKTWLPLFAARVTANARQHFQHNDLDPDVIKERLLDMRQKKLAESSWIQGADEKSRATIVVLAAVSHPPRMTEAISGKTGLGILEIERELKQAISNGWIDDKRRVTDAGHEQLKHARKRPPKKIPPSKSNKKMYYPKSLRAPVEHLADASL